jgi:hypothetical protein
MSSGYGVNDDAVDLFGDLIVAQTSTTAISLCVEITSTARGLRSRCDRDDRTLFQERPLNL